MKLFKLNPAHVFLAVFFVLFAVNTAVAGDTAISAGKKLSASQITKGPKQLAEFKFKTDVVVREIYANDCPCEQEITRTGAMFFKGLNVIVGNYSCPGGAVADNVNASLKVEYYDLMLDRIVTLTKPVTFSINNTKTVNFTNNYLLMKRSHGVKATLTVTSGSVEDCNMTNNSNRVYACDLRPVY